MADYSTCEDDSTSLGDSPKILPIILVPGIMGTRLDRTVDRTPVAVWDPIKEGLGRKASSSDNLLRHFKCYPDEGWTATFGDLPDGFGAYADQIGHVARTSTGEVDPARSWGTCFSVLPCYYDLVFALADVIDKTNYLAAIGVTPKVYCAGYDFRADNRVSAQTLQKLVDKALAECGAEKVVLVAHSMGGLVSRCYARQHPDKVQALFLVASPSLGAVAPYALLKQFDDNLMAGVLFGLGAVSMLLSPEPARARALQFVRYNMPSIYQLAASDHYTVACKNDDWLQFDDELAADDPDPMFEGGGDDETGWGLFGPPTDCSNVSKVYRNGHTGFIDYDDGEWQVQSDFLDSAMAFHSQDLAASELSISPGGGDFFGGTMFDAKLIAWMHPRTYIVYSKQHPTITSGKLNEEGQFEAEMAPGDSSVPLCSAAVADDMVGPKVKEGERERSPILERYEVTSDEVHQYVPVAPGAIAWIKKKLVAECQLSGLAAAAEQLSTPR